LGSRSEVKTEIAVIARHGATSSKRIAKIGNCHNRRNFEERQQQVNFGDYGGFGSSGNLSADARSRTVVR